MGRHQKKKRPHNRIITEHIQDHFRFHSLQVNLALTGSAWTAILSVTRKRRPWESGSFILINKADACLHSSLEAYAKSCTSNGVDEQWLISPAQFNTTVHITWAWYEKLIFCKLETVFSQSCQIIGYQIQLGCNIKFKQNIFHLFFKDFIYFQTGEKGRRKRGRETSMCARETSISCLLLAPNQGPGPQPKHVPWQNQTCDLSVCRMMLNPLCYTS